MSNPMSIPLQLELINDAEPAVAIRRLYFKSLMRVVEVLNLQLK